MSAPAPFLEVYERDLTLVGGRGARLEAADGRRFLDFASGIGVNGLGYGDRKVVAAIRAQAGRIIHASNLFHNQPAAELARRLVGLAFPSRVFFCNSGAEAVEAAIKFARKIGRPAGRSELVAFEHGFHGRTCGALSLTWAPKYREPFEPLLPGVRFCPWDDLEALDAAVGDETAAVVIEPIQGEGGVRPASDELMRGAAEICRRSGALLIVDEIQCGLGRTGDMFAHAASGVEPDVMTLAKPLGGGLPMGAALLAERHAAALSPGDHGSTFGGNPVAAAASLAVLDRLCSDGFLEKVRRSGKRLASGLRGIQRRHEQLVAGVRGRGLMLGVQLRRDPGPVLKGLRERGVLATKASNDVLRLLPPLVVKPGEIKELVEALDAVLAGLSGQPSAERSTQPGAARSTEQSGEASRAKAGNGGDR